jgi:hypothetical protein
MKLMITIIGLFILSSCHTIKSNTRHDKDIVELQKQIVNIKDQLRSHSFMIEIDACVVNYNKCMHDSSDKRKCWHTQEACVIAVHRMYKSGNVLKHQRSR